MAVRYNELEEAFACVSFGPPMDNAAHKNDLDLGKDLVLRFVAQELPDQAERVGGFFRRKGAYARFKDLLDSEGLLEEWYNFEAEASERALRDWCAENDIQIVKQNDDPSA